MLHRLIMLIVSWCTHQEEVPSQAAQQSKQARETNSCTTSGQLAGHRTWAFQLSAQVPPRNQTLLGRRSAYHSHNFFIIYYLRNTRMQEYPSQMLTSFKGREKRESRLHKCLCFLISFSKEKCYHILIFKRGYYIKFVNPFENICIIYVYTKNTCML